MRRLIRELQRVIKKEASVESIDGEKLIDLLTAYQILKKYKDNSNDFEDEEPLPKLVDLDFKIIGHIGNGQSTLKNIFSNLKTSRSTISYHIEVLVEKNILMKIPTVSKDKPIVLTDKGKKIFEMMKKDL